MKTTITAEFIKLLKDKRFRTMLVNFTDNVIRLTFEERSQLTKNNSIPFYHIKADESRYTKQSGMSRIEHYYFSAILAVIRPGDILSFSIDTNGTENLRQAGFEWQFLRVECYRKDKFICEWHMDNCIMDKGNHWLPLNNVVQWNETRFNEFVTY
jgi:hypothetical protein